MACPDPPARPVPLSEADRAKLINSVRALVRKLARDSGARPGDVDDLEQDCLLELWKASPRYDPRKGKFTTFASRVCRGCISEKVRGAAKRRVTGATTMDHPERVPDREPTEPEADDESGDPTGAGSILRQLALTALGAGLTPKERGLFALLADGLTGPQIADQLGKKLSLVEISIRQLVGKLVASGRLPPELVERFRRQKKLERVNPARRVVGGVHPDQLDQPVTIDGETLPLREAARRRGIGASLLRTRLAHGWSAERILGTPAASRPDSVPGGSLPMESWGTASGNGIRAAGEPVAAES